MPRRAPLAVATHDRRPRRARFPADLDAAAACCVVCPSRARARVEERARRAARPCSPSRDGRRIRRRRHRRAARRRIRADRLRGRRPPRERPRRRGGGRRVRPLDRAGARLPRRAPLQGDLPVTHARLAGLAARRDGPALRALGPAPPLTAPGRRRAGQRGERRLVVGQPRPHRALPALAVVVPELGVARGRERHEPHEVGPLGREAPRDRRSARCRRPRCAAPAPARRGPRPARRPRRRGCRTARPARSAAGRAGCRRARARRGAPARAGAWRRPGASSASAKSSTGESSTTPEITACTRERIAVCSTIAPPIEKPTSTTSRAP